MALEMDGFSVTIQALEKGYEIWHVECQEPLYRAGSLKTVARELGKYKLDLVGVQEVRGLYIFLWKGE
jgi:hypothetical protein